MQFDMSLTFDSLLEPLTSSLVRSAPQTLVCALIGRLPLVLALRDQRDTESSQSVSQSVSWTTHRTINIIKLFKYKVLIKSKV